VRLSKGAHVLVDVESAWTAALTVPQDDVRVTFAVPWYGMLLLGTTDTAWEAAPDEVEVDPQDVTQILDEAAVALASDLVAADRVRAAYAGLRVLPAGDGESVSARRETVFTRSAGGMLNVAGGKLTTYRRIALEALSRLRSDLGLRRLETRPWPLPGATGLERPLPADLEPEVGEHLLHLYGSLAHDVVATAVDDPSLLERLHPDGPDIAAQVVYAHEREWARDAGDVLRRPCHEAHAAPVGEKANEVGASLVRAGGRLGVREKAGERINRRSRITHRRCPEESQTRGGAPENIIRQTIRGGGDISVVSGLEQCIHSIHF
jgi:glycerol-3-phosphate dehydrogenase